jgi:hypothetical protein
MRSLPSTARVVTSSKKTFCLWNVLTTLTVIRIIYQSKIDIMVLGFSTHPKPSSLDARENNPNEFAKARWVQRRHPFSAAPVCVMRENPIARYRTATLLANGIQPDEQVSLQ